MSRERGTFPEKMMSGSEGSLIYTVWNALINIAWNASASEQHDDNANIQYIHRFITGYWIRPSPDSYESVYE